MDLPESKQQLSMEVDARTCLGAFQFMIQAATQANDTASATRWNQSFQLLAQQAGFPLQ